MKLHPFFPVHDLTHCAVESAFGFREAFFGAAEFSAALAAVLRSSGAPAFRTVIETVPFPALLA